MAPRKKTVHISEQAHRYLEECVRMGVIIFKRKLGMQYFTEMGIRLMFAKFVRELRDKDLAHFLDDELVQHMKRDIESMTPEKTEDREGRKGPQ